MTLSGVSIGGTIALILAGRRNPRIARVVAINSYDYAVDPTTLKIGHQQLERAGPCSRP